jgi:hypothetical protein
MKVIDVLKSISPEAFWEWYQHEVFFAMIDREEKNGFIKFYNYLLTVTPLQRFDSVVYKRRDFRFSKDVKYKDICLLELNEALSIEVIDNMNSDEDKLCLITSFMEELNDVESFEIQLRDILINEEKIKRSMIPKKYEDGVWTLPGSVRNFV